jgi:hypothetical protein
LLGNVVGLTSPWFWVHAVVFGVWLGIYEVHSRRAVLFRHDEGCIEETSETSFESLEESHDGADLKAARAEGWEVWVEGMDNAYRYELKEEKPRYKLFDINWTDDRCPQVKGFRTGEFPLLGDNYRIFGFTDDQEWAPIDATCHEYQAEVYAYASQPCDHTGNRKYAIGRLGD